MAESAAAPPGPIPNPVVTRRSAGEYCGGDSTGGEAAADAPRLLSRQRSAISFQLAAIVDEWQGGGG